MNRRTIFTTLTVLTVLLLVPTLPAQEAPGRTLEFTVYLHEPLHIVPERIEAKVGDTLSFNILNPNDSPHDLLVCADPVHPGSECTKKLAYAAVSPQGSAPLKVTLTEPGTYEYYCTIPGHKQGGMRAELVVQGSATEKKTPGMGAPVATLALVGIALLLRRQTR